MRNTQTKPPDLAPFNARLQAHLGDQLRRSFAEIVRQPIPDGLVTLLGRLETDGDAVRGPGKSARLAPRDPASQTSLRSTSIH